MPTPTIDLLKQSSRMTMHSHVASDITGLDLSGYVEVAGDTMTGGLTIQPATDTLTALVVNDKDANNIFTVDSINNRVGIGTASPAHRLDVNGSIGINGKRMLHDAQVFGGFTGTMIVGDGGQSLTYVSADNGYYNTLVGLGAGYSLTTGRFNTVIGNDALNKATTGFSNVALGTLALYNTTTGGINVALGREALYTNSTGGSNSAFGYAALYKNTSGSFNMAIGRQSMYENTTGGYNSAIGYQSLYYNTTGTYNTAIAASALLACTTGSHNLALGYQSGRYQADGSTALQTPNNSLYLGAYTRGKDNNDNNSIVIGYQAIGLGANTAVIGNSSITLTAIQGNLGLGTTAPTNLLSLGGNAARTFWLERHTTSNTAGNILTITAGGATSGATDKAGGALVLQGGLSTGSAESGVTIQGCVAGASGTTDGTQTTAIQVLGNKIGFFTATPVVQQTELTDELTTITHTAPGTPDYAIQDLVDSSAGATFGFATKDEGNSVLAVIANLQARVNELETKLTNYGLLIDAD